MATRTPSSAAAWSHWAGTGPRGRSPAGSSPYGGYPGVEHWVRDRGSRRRMRSACRHPRRQLGRLLPLLSQQKVAGRPHWRCWLARGMEQMVSPARASLTKETGQLKLRLLRPSPHASVPHRCEVCVRVALLRLPRRGAPSGTPTHVWAARGTTTRSPAARARIRLGAYSSRQGMEILLPALMPLTNGCHRSLIVLEGGSTPGR
jgi:hypothetical protein